MKRAVKPVTNFYALYKGMPVGSVLQCPLCDYSGRSDHLHDHIVAIHKDKEEILKRPMPANIEWRQSEVNPNVLYQAVKEETGTLKCHNGVCFACGHFIKKSQLHKKSSTLVYDTHTCKEKRKRGPASAPAQPRPAAVAAAPQTQTKTETPFNSSSAFEDMFISIHKILSPYGFQVEFDDSLKCVVDMTQANLLTTLKSLSAKIKTLSAGENIDKVWKLFEEANIPGFEKPESDSDADSSDEVERTAENMAAIMTREIEGYKKALQRKEVQMQRRFEGQLLTMKTEAEEQDKKLGEQARLILEQQDEMKHKDKLIKKLMDELSKKEAAAESESDTEAVTVEPTQIKKKVFIKNEIQSKEYRTKLIALS